MNSFRVLDITLPSPENSSEFSVFFLIDSKEILIKNELTSPTDPSTLAKLKCKSLTGQQFETHLFDLNLIATNQILSLPLYHLPNNLQSIGKIQVTCLPVPSSPSKLPDLLDLHNFSSSSKASTLNSDEPNSAKLQNSLVLEGINEELKNSLIKHKKIHEIDKSTKESLLQELKRLTQELLKARDEWKKRENSILGEIENLESIVTALKFDLIRCKNENSALAAENSRILSTSQSYQTISQHFDDLKSNPNNQSFSFSELDALRKSTSGSATDCSELLKQKDQIIKNLTSDLNEARVLNKSILLSRQMMKGTELDEILTQKLRVLKLPGSFVRDPEQSFLFGGKKVIMMVKTGQLMCKVGSVFRPFDEFVKAIGATSKSGLHKRIKSWDSFGESSPRSANSSISRSKISFSKLSS